MADHDRRFAQVVILTPPPTHRQFATERVRARIKKRRAGTKLRETLDRRAEADEQGRARVNPAEVARVWNLTRFRDLRANLPPAEQQKLWDLLAAVMSGETAPEVWWATINALAALRRASEPAVGATRRWRQTWSPAGE
jgi:hypothetical protein